MSHVLTNFCKKIRAPSCIFFLKLKKKDFISIYPLENGLPCLGLPCPHPKLIMKNCGVATTIKLEQTEAKEMSEGKDV